MTCLIISSTDPTLTITCLIISSTDPTLTIDTDKVNKEFMDQSEEFYLAVENSRWFGIDSNTSTYDDVCKS